MYVVVETWRAKREFLAAPIEFREELFARIKAAMAEMAQAGIVTLGWGSVDRSADHSTDYDWFAVWQAPNAELAAAFLQGVERSGWYTWFEQVNVLGEVRTVDAIAAEHLALEGARTDGARSTDSGGPDLPGLASGYYSLSKQENPMSEEALRNIVLVHGGFVDGSGWQGVYDLLTADGYSVQVVQNPTVSLAGDVAATKMAIAGCEGPVVLVGHSYGGVVVTEAGTDEKVAALVYIAGFVPDTGESVNTLIADPPPGAPVPPILPPKDGFLFLDREKFAASFAADVPPGKAAFMADSQVPWGVEALQGAVTKPAWRTLPSWYLLTTEDRMIPPAAQQAMSTRAGSSVTEVAASHSVYVSQPQAVASIIKKAAAQRG